MEPLLLFSSIVSLFCSGMLLLNCFGFELPETALLMARIVQSVFLLAVACLVWRSRRK